MVLQLKPGRIEDPDTGFFLLPQFGPESIPGLGYLVVSWGKVEFDYEYKMVNVDLELTRYRGKNYKFEIPVEIYLDRKVIKDTFVAIYEKTYEAAAPDGVFDNFFDLLVRGLEMWGNDFLRDVRYDGNIYIKY